MGKNNLQHYKVGQLWIYPRNNGTKLEIEKIVIGRAWINHIRYNLVMLLDSHCHLTKQFLEDPTDVIRKAKENGVGKMICVGTNLEDSKQAIEIANTFEGIFASVGIHPEETCEDWSEFEKLILEPKVVAIGECGLDYKIGLPNQKEIFEKQIFLAKKHDKPLIVHCREGQDEMKRILGAARMTHGVMHCFSGNKEYLDYVLNLGFYVSFAGNVTFKNANELQELAKLTPTNRLLVETDSPFLSPEPLRGSRNTPANVKIVAWFLANLKDISFDELEKITSKNATDLFDLT